jgi:hypothetical protein
MATISNPQNLLPLLGSVAAAEDPVAALEQRGHQVATALKTRLQPHRRPTPTKRKLWNKMAAKAGTLAFTAGQPHPITARQLAPGEYEFSAGVRMSLANEILAGLHANGTVPDVIFLDRLLSAGNIDLLQGAFRMDRPGGRIGRFQITAPPTLEPIREALDRVAFVIPFRLNFERIVSIFSGEVRSVVTFATGRLRLSVGLVTQVVPVSVAARNLEIQIDLSSSSEARLEIDPSSPVQRTSPPPPGGADGLAIILQNALQQRLAGSLRFTVSAAIPLPIGKLEIHEIAILTRGDALLVGIKVQGTPGSGNPATLTALFSDAQTNFFSRVHDQVLRLIVQSAARSGELTRMAQQTHPDAVIDSADVAFGNGTIELRATGKIVDLCPLGVDLGFTATVTLTITLEGTRIRVKKETSTDLDNSDAVLCVVTSLGLALLAAVAVITFQGWLAGLAAFGVFGVLTLMLEFDGDDFDLAVGGGGGGGDTLVDLDFPFPGSDLLPTLTGLFIRLDDSTMLIAAHLGTRPDNLNTYFYVRFLEAGGFALARPMQGVQVQLMDRDSPAPEGDDVTLPGPSTTQSSQPTPGGGVVITKRTRFVRGSDETFRQVTTDHAGRIRIYIPSDKLASKAGSKVVETTRLNVDTERETTSTVRTPIPEARPDFYFRIARPNGTFIDTLGLPAGFFLNFQSSRIGTRASPLTITFGGAPIVVLDPDVE